MTLFDLIVKFGIYGKNELQKELKVRDDIAAKLADTSEAGLIPRFIKKSMKEKIWRDMTS